jgi:hypothetical protein
VTINKKLYVPADQNRKELGKLPFYPQLKIYPRYIACGGILGATMEGFVFEIDTAGKLILKNAESKATAFTAT